MSTVVSLPRPRQRGQSVDAEAEPLQTLIERCNGRFPPSQRTIEDALDTGLAELMELHRRLDAIDDHATAARSPRKEAEHHGLVEQIDSLREAIRELRAHLEAGRASPLVYGFVLPRDR
jgi:hypothetical protein